MKILANVKTGCFVLALLSFSCKPAGQQKSETQPVTTAVAVASKVEVKPLPDTQQKPVLAASIAPGHCRVVGMVTAISPQPEATAAGICGQTPCRAKVKILKIIGYGHLFHQTLTANQEINAYFKYSLKPTTQLLPELATPLPGLKVNSVFTADISTSSGEAGNSMPWYQIGLYQVE
jgi:hypothetical protein